MKQIDQAAREWVVARVSGPDLPAIGVEFAGTGDELYKGGEGARLTLAEANDQLAQLGPPWIVLHCHTMVGERDHQRWLNTSHGLAYVCPAPIAFVAPEPLEELAEVMPE